jgi:hypothetical protein
MILSLTSNSKAAATTSVPSKTSKMRLTMDLGVVISRGSFFKAAKWF